MVLTETQGKKKHHQLNKVDNSRNSQLLLWKHSEKQGSERNQSSIIEKEYSDKVVGKP